MSINTVHGKPAAPVIGALLLSALAYALAQTLVAPAIPALTREFGTESSTTSWVLTGFLLSASVCTPLAGKLGDLFGKARVLTGVLLIFSFGSIVSALAGSIEMVIAGRVIQGVAGGVFPLAFGIINDELPAERRSVAIGMISAMFGIGGGIGLPLSGAIVDNTDISWLFWIGLLALPAAFLVHRVVPASPARERTRIDWAGAALLSLGLAALLLGISKANAWGWGSGRTMVALLGGVAVLGVFVAFELRRSQPLVDMRVLAERPVLATNITGFLIGVAMFGSFLMIPQFAQAPESTGYGFGMTVLQSGLLMAPASFVMLVCGPLAGLLGNRIGFRAVLAAGTVANAISFAILARRARHDGAVHRVEPHPRRRHLLRVRVDGEPHREPGRPERGRRRDRDQHDHADGRRRVRRRRRDRAADRRHDRRLEHPDRARLHRGVHDLDRHLPARAARRAVDPAPPAATSRAGRPAAARGLTDRLSG